MGKQSPLAKALRTFAALMVAPLTAAAAVNWFGGEWQLGATRLTLAVIAAALAGLIAALTALKEQTNATTPVGKAFATFLQGTVAGLATVVVADLTLEAGVQFASLVGSVLVSSALGALGSLALNAAEDSST